MKKLLKTIILASTLTLGLTANAQSEDFNSKDRFIVAAGVELPIGDLADATSGIGFGLNLKYEHPIADNKAAITGNIGFDYFGGQKLDAGVFGSFSYSISSIPLLGGAKYYFNNKFYGQAELGLAYTTLSSKFTTLSGIDANGNPMIVEGNISSTFVGLGFTIGAGYIANIGKRGLDLGIKYNSYSLGSENNVSYGSLGFISLRAGIPLN